MKKITRDMLPKIKAPKFKVAGKFILNEYELRCLLLEVAKGNIQSGISVMDMQSKQKGFIREDGAISNDIGDSLRINGHYMRQLYEIPKISKENIIKLWKMIPKYAGSKEKSDDNKFQTLQGRNSILVKLEQMIKESSENILVLGTESDFKKFYHTEFTDLLKKTKSELRILTDYSNKGMHIFEDVPSKKIKKLDDKSREDFCFIIKDDSEVIFFMSNSELKDMRAMWTDSKTFVTTLRSLFSLIWKKAHHIDESNAESLLGSEITYEHRLREIEQEKIILSYLQKNFKLLENKLGVKK